MTQDTGLDQIDVEKYREEMDKILASYNLPANALEFVDGFPNAPHTITRNYKIERKIRFKKLITAEDRAMMMQALYRFEEKDLETLKDDWRFVKHRLLSEVHHIFNRYQTDYECDKWAFYLLKKG